jgi:hypothetical protein
MAPSASVSHAPISTESEIELKSANGASTVANSTKKRSRSERDQKAAVKKQRLKNGTGGEPDTLKSQKSKKTRESTSEDKKKPKEKKARKSVSFAADTKSSSEDEPEQKQQLIITPEKRRAEKRLKREQRVKRKAQAPPPRPTDTTEEPASNAILSYLSLYHTSRSQWKFQKNRGTQLLKHAFSIDRVPPSYNPALATYLAGLKGTGARTRLAEAAGHAIEAQDEELNKMEGQDTEKAQFGQQVSLFQEKLGEDVADLQEETDGASSLDKAWRNRLEKRKRAELVYFLMRGQLSTEKRQTPSTQKKKRKSRTAVVDDTSSSSSESESDSDSSSNDSDSDSDTDGGGITLANSAEPSRKQNDTDSEPTSSSGESSSSEDSDSD